MFKGWLTRFPAANGLRKSDNLKPDSIRIREREFISTIIGKPVLLSRYMIQAPRAQPVAGGIAGCQRSAIG